MAERTNAAVLKTADPKGFVGSNPTPSASAALDRERMGEMERFGGELEAQRGGGCSVEVPADVIAALGGLRVRVKGTLNGVSFSSNTMSIGGGRAVLAVHKATRQAAGATFGDTVAIELERDDAPRQLEVPADLSAALARDDLALAVFERLSFSHKREHAAYVTEAKRPETRARRIEETLRQLRLRA